MISNVSQIYWTFLSLLQIHEKPAMMNKQKEVLVTFWLEWKTDVWWLITFKLRQGHPDTVNMRVSSGSFNTPERASGYTFVFTSE